MVTEKSTRVKQKNKRGRKPKAPKNQRAVWVWLDTPSMVDEWKKMAKESNVSTSTFVKEIVEKHLASQGAITARGTIEDQLKEAVQQGGELRTENIELNKKLERMNTLLDKYEDQIKESQNNKFLDSEFNGIRDFREELVDLLRDKHQIKEEKILDLLHIVPSDSKGIKAIGKQIEILLEYGLIKRYKGGYLWKG
jgi:hypothetical protein